MLGIAELVLKSSDDCQDDRVRESAEIFAIDLMDHQINFNVCGMFSLDNQFTSEVVQIY